MMTHLETFSDLEVQEIGRWHSDAWRAYARLHGVAAKNVMNKIHSKLSLSQVGFVLTLL